MVLVKSLMRIAKGTDKLTTGAVRIPANDTRY